MDLSIERDGPERLVCTLVDDNRSVVLTSSDAEAAAADLLAALESAEQTGYGECLWQEAAGDYRWMFRRTGDRVTLATLWSMGTLTGWQNVLQVETNFAMLAARVRAEIARLGAHAS